MTAPAVSRAWPVTRQPVPLSRVDVRLVRLPLVEPFETSNERFESRLIMIVTLTSGAVTGWGEVVAAEAPAYSYETVETARHVIRDFLAPAVLASPIAGLQDLAARLAVFTGHPMAKAGVELAYLDLVSQLESQSLATLLSGSRTEVDVGVSLGIQRSIDDLLERVDRYLALGYRRIKLKIKPGWDVEVVRDVRRHHPDILLSVDANNAYALRDRALLARLDAFNLLMIEQLRASRRHLRQQPVLRARSHRAGGRGLEPWDDSGADDGRSRVRRRSRLRRGQNGGPRGTTVIRRPRYPMPLAAAHAS